MWRSTLTYHEPGIDESIERRVQFLVALACHGRDQRVGKLPADRRTDLRYFLGGAEAIQARHQRGVQRGRECKRGGRNNRCGVSRFRLAAGGFQDRSRHLLDEQRDSVGPFDDLRHDLDR